MFFCTFLTQPVATRWLHGIIQQLVALGTRVLAQYSFSIPIQEHRLLDVFPSHTVRAFHSVYLKLQSLSGLLVCVCLLTNNVVLMFFNQLHLRTVFILPCNTRGKTWDGTLARVCAHGIQSSNLRFKGLKVQYTVHIT